MCFSGHKPIDTHLLLDSRADFSMIPKDLTEGLGINIATCPKISTSGIGGEINVAENLIWIKFGQRNEIYELEIPIQIPLKEGVGMPLLGRALSLESLM